MKINFDWHNYMSKNDQTKNSQTTEGALNSQKNVREASSVYSQTMVDISGKLTDDFHYTDQGRLADSLKEVINSEDYVAIQRNFMTVMSNSMSASDFQKMKEEGFDVSSMEPDQVVTILDKIKTVLAQSGTHIEGYNDNLSVDKIEEITGNSGYAQTIVKELSKADAPVTEENVKELDQVIEQALIQERLSDGSIIYMLRQGMEPTLSNFYKAEHSGVQEKYLNTKMGYTSNSYNRQGTDVAQGRRTLISEKDYQQIENQIKKRIESDGLKADSQTIEDGKWLLEKGLPVTKANIALLQELKNVEFPLDINKIIKQAANAIGEGKSPFGIQLNKKADNIYEEAVKIRDRYQKISFQAVDETVHNKKECNLKNMESFEGKYTDSIPQLQARKVLEEVRLKMTVEANVKLLKSGYSIETASMEDLIKQLEKATKSLKEDIFGSKATDQKAEMFSKTQSYLKEIPTLPISVIGKIPSMEKATISNVVEEGKILQKQYEQANNTYETIMTAPRADLGDSIRKAFRNVDDILMDMDLELSDANRRAVRIMGYNQITITEDNLEKIKKADRQVQNIIENIKPGMTLQMIREGKNPLEMPLDEIQQYLQERENDFVNDTQKFSEFLYKLEKKNDITEAEREAYIGVYRLFRQIEKSDGAVIGSLVNQNAEISFSNLLSSVRSSKAKHTDVKVDDTVGMISEIKKRGNSISEQIEKGFATVQNTIMSTEKTPEDIVKQVQEIQKDDSLEKQLIKQQMQELREGIALAGKEKEYLEIYQQPVTLDNMQSVMNLNEKRGITFKKIIQLEKEASTTDIEKAEESILKEAQ